MRLVILLSMALALSSVSQRADAESFYQIPVPADAREFARLDKKLPAVLSFYTHQTESELRDFYLQQLGDPTDEQMQYGRIQLYFVVNGKQARVIISSREEWRQVDIMIQN
ncbi:hypothetical protein [Rheinheimera baltica]|uniref:hypothetical protein n=1 Tax=Rheinheimera baltica TaxID=67576 RepID=UPI0003FC02A9|nr:hypothetical protein [Rheinheimera baltica]